MSVAYALNTLWMLRCRSEAARFQAAVQSPSEAQASVLRAILAANKDCEWGCRYGFASISSIEEYQRRVPLASYDAISSDVDRIAAGEPSILTSEPALLLEPTSGSTGAEKLIPYTASLRRQYQRAISPWIWDALGRYPQARGGRAYWSISPAMGPRRTTAGGIPIGFEDDTAYLPAWERWAAQRVLAAPPELARLERLDDFRYLTLLCLLAAGDLSLISIWSPTFLTSLLASLPAWQERIVFDLKRGIASPLGAAREQPLKLAQRARQRRAAELRNVFRSVGAASEQLAAIWPRLALISCWTDASAALFVPGLARLFPRTPIQSKGLLATEGAVSFPWGEAEGGVLAVRSHFLEFAPADVSADRPACRLAHQLERGGRYRVILTTGGGLYRYDLNDLVEVVGFAGQCPRVKFLGRVNKTGDLVGEKLSEAHAQQAVQDALTQMGLSPAFALLAPEMSEPPHYALFLQDASLAQPQRRAALAEAIESRLAANPHYRYAVELGQLGCAVVRPLAGESADAWRLFEAHRVAQGQKPGDIKPCLFDASTAWPSVLAPLLASPHLERYRNATSTTDG